MNKKFIKGMLVLGVSIIAFVLLVFYIGYKGNIAQENVKIIECKSEAKNRKITNNVDNNNGNFKIKKYEVEKGEKNQNKNKYTLKNNSKIKMKKKKIIKQEVQNQEVKQHSDSGKKENEDITEKLRNSKDVIIKTGIRNIILKNKHLYYEFKKKVDNEQEATLKYVYFTKEGDPIIIDLNYSNDKGFELIHDSKYDRFGEKTITRTYYKYLYEYNAIACQKDVATIHFKIYLSNLNNKNEAFKDKTQTRKLFEWSRKEK